MFVTRLSIRRAQDLQRVGRPRTKRQIRMSITGAPAKSAPPSTRSVDHSDIITSRARGKAVSFPYRDGHALARPSRRRRRVFAVSCSPTRRVIPVLQHRAHLDAWARSRMCAGFSTRGSRSSTRPRRRGLGHHADRQHAAWMEIRRAVPAGIASRVQISTDVRRGGGCRRVSAP